MIKIEGGTPRGDAHLCKTCTRATIAKGPKLSDEIIYCHSLETRITFPVHTCTRHDANTQDLQLMKEDALYIDVNKKNNKVGFRTWNDLSDTERWRDLC